MTFSLVFRRARISRALPGLLALAWLFGASIALPAQVTVVDQYPATPAFGIGATTDSNCTFGSPNRALSQADDFVVTSAVNVDSVEFLGTLPLTASVPPSNPTPFVVRFLTDVTGSPGLPGALVAQPTVTITQTLLVDGGNLGLFGFVATFSPVPLNPGTYWLELFETDDTTTTCFGWSDAPLDAVRGRDGWATDLNNAPGTSWINQNTNTANNDNQSMRITGQAAAACVPNGVQFGASTYSVNENAGTVSLTVLRTGDCASDVAFAPSPGTATPPDDYSGLSGFLLLAAGGPPSITLNLAIADDLVPEALEDFTVQLSQSDPDTTVGPPSLATVSIVDNDLASVVEVPTLGEIGLGILIVGLGFAGGRRARGPGGVGPRPDNGDTAHHFPQRGAGPCE
jgi:hypothetical protein